MIRAAPARHLAPGGATTEFHPPERSLRVPVRALVDVIRIGRYMLPLLVEDPARLGWLAAHRLPARIVMPVAKLFAVRPGRPGATRALARALLSRDDASVDLDSLAASAAPWRRRAALAVAAISGDDSRTVPWLAALPVDDRRAGCLRSRLLWSRGDLSSAIAALQPLTGRRAQRLARRMGGEAHLLRGGWQPRWTAADHAGALDGGLRGGHDRSVLHLVTNSLPRTRSGYAVRTHEVLLAQRARGWGSEAVTRLGYPLTIGSLSCPPLEHLDGVPYHRVTGPIPAQPVPRMEQQVRALLGVASRVHPTVLHTTTHWPNGLAALAAGRELDIPVVYEVRGFLEDTWAAHAGSGSTRSEKYLLSRDRETDVMRHADAVVTLGRAMREEIAGRGVDEKKIVVVPNAVDGAFLRAPPDAAALRHRLGIHPEDVVVGTVSSLVRYEGLDMLLRAVHRLRSRAVPAVALVVGDGADRERLLRLAIDLDLGPAAVFTGRVPRSSVLEYHAAIDVFAVPRTAERVCRLVTPLKPVEAMALHRPVVASDLPALRELVTEGVTGMLAPSADLDAWVETLEPLLGDPLLRERLGRAGHSQVSASRTWARGARTYEQLYLRLLGRHAGEHGGAVA